MTPERYKRIGELYHAALEIDADERAAFLDRECSGDAELRSEVESLIASHEQSADFIASPALGVAAELLAEETADALIGRTIANYKILSLLGAGGMGRVYLAEDTRLGRRVALKFLPEYFTNDKNQVQRFRQEARAASALNHPNILTVHEVGQVDGTDFIATEYVEGETLRDRLKDTPMRALEAIDVAAQVADALAAAHQAGIIHRDIKPENVMLRTDGYVKVLDFGLAKLTEKLFGLRGSQLEAPTKSIIRTNPGVVMGTMQYMSPEQARGLPVDARTDLWSIGVLLYEMIAGQPPFKGETPSDILVSILEKEPASVLTHAPALPAELERIISKALTKDREERYQTAKDMAIDLRRLRRRLYVEAELERSAQPEAVSASTDAISGGQRAFAQTVIQATARISEASEPRATSSVEYLVSEIKRHRRGATVFGAALVLVLIGASYAAYRLLKAPALASFQSTNVTRLTSTGKAKLAAISPDGKYLAYAEEDAKQSLWVKQVATGSNVQIVPPADVRYWGLTFSNDSNYIYYVRNEQTNPLNVLYQVASLGGPSTKLIEHVDSAITFSPDGRRLAFVRDFLKKQESALVLANADGSEERVLAMRKSPHFFWSDVSVRPAWSPNGKIIACPGRFAGEIGSYYELVGVSVEDGSEKLLTTQRLGYVRQVAWLSDGTGLVMIAREQEGTTTQIWHLAYPSGEVRRITNDLNAYGDVSLTADSGALVTVQTNQVSNIWLSNKADTERIRQITSSTFDSWPNWSPDGRIVYVSNASGKSDIWIMDADGTNQRRLTHEGQNGSPTVSRDGRYIVFSSARAGQANVWRMEIDGSNPKQLTSGKRNVNSDLSPDGRWVVYVSFDSGNGTLWRVSIDGGGAIQLSGPTANLPVVSPDGKQIACFYWDEQANPPRGAMILPFEGGPPIKRFNIGPHSGGFALQWAIDGRALLYIGPRHANIWSQPVDGGESAQLTHFQGDQIFNFAYSPDGKWLAVARGRVTDDVVLIRDSK